VIRRAKTRPPPLTPDYLHRPRLGARLSTGAAGPAILVSAPAGYGKRTLIRHWLETRDEPCAWVCLDAADNDLRLLLDYLIHAIQSAVPGSCERTERLVHGPETSSISEISSSLVSEIDEIQTRFLLVLDGLETITDAEVFSLFDLFLEHRLESLCVVMCTRKGSPFSLSRLRARGELVELGLQDLAFNQAETEALIMKNAGISVSREALDNLDARLEGWPVALRLLMSVLPDEPDPQEFLLNLDTGPRSIDRYLEDEVLAHESPCTRSCLYKTSILDRFSGPLWDTVARSRASKRVESPSGEVTDVRDPMHAPIDRGLYVIQMDIEGHWHRYHPSFRRLLRENLDREYDAEAVAVLHLRASEWFETEGLISEAIAHALEAGATILAAEIVERNQFALLNAGEGSQLGKWLEQLPADLRRERFGLLMAEALAAYQQFEIWKIPALLKKAEALDNAPSKSPERTFLVGVIEFFNGENRHSAKAFEEVLELVPDVDSWLRLDSHFYRGVSLHIGGNGDKALQLIGTALADSLAVQDSNWTRLVGASTFLKLLRGDLVHDCPSTDRLSDSTRTHVESWYDYVLGISAFRSFDLERAIQLLRRVSLSHDWLTIDAQAALTIAYQMLGRPDDARDCLARAWDTASWSGESHQLLPLVSCEARLALLTGDVATASSWQQSYRRTSSLSLSRFCTEVPAITECRVLAASPSRVELRLAAKKLDELWDGFGAIHYGCQQLEIAPLRAIVLERLGEEERAVDALRESIEMAAPQRWIRPYVELGTGMAKLVERLPANSPNQAFVAELRAALLGDRVVTGTVARFGSADRVFESLTNRELDVLELLIARLRDKEIAERLSISPQTVKTHLRSLYRKLGCRNRREAVAKALERGGLTRNQPANPV